MNKLIFFLVSAVVTIFFHTPIYSQTLNRIPQGSIIAAGDDRIVIINPKVGLDSSGIIWNWQVKESSKDLPNEYLDHFRSLDDCKPIENNKKILVTSSSGATCIVNVSDKRIVFFALTPMAHSADTLPKDLIAIANSTHLKGNSLELYSRLRPDKLLWADSIFSGHGVLWSEKYRSLFVLGFDILREYKIFRRGGKINLVRFKETPLPVGEKIGGHELSYYDEDRLIVADQDAVFIFNIKDNTFSTFLPLQDIKDVKSINYNNKTKQLIFTKAEVGWWTFNIYSKNPDYKINNLPFKKMYKVRAVF